MSSKIERNLPNNAYQAAVNAENPSATNPYVTESELPTVGTGNQLISGGASYSGTGMVFNVSVLVYTIEGVEYTTPAVDVTLLVGDPSNPRFDAIVATLDSNEIPLVEVVQGTPAGTPSTPTLEPDQVLVQYVLIGANATNPSITTEYVYRNDQTSDWQGSVNDQYCGIPNSADFTSSTPTPVAGAACVLTVSSRFGITSGTTSPRGLKFATPNPVSREDYAVLSFYINFPSPGFTQQGKENLYLSLWADNVFPTSNKGAHYLGYVLVQNYCNINLLDTWQLVNIPTAAFFQGPTLTTIGGMCFTSLPNLCGVEAKFALDEIKLQTGFGPQLNIATVDVFDKTNFIGSTAKLSFVSKKGHRNKITPSISGDSVNIQLNNLGVEEYTTAGATLNINAETTSAVIINAQDVNFIINTPTGNPINGQKLIFRMLDDGNASIAKAITWSAIFEPIGVTLPGNLTATKLLYVGCIYNSNSGKWDVVAITEEA